MVISMFNGLCFSLVRDSFSDPEPNPDSGIFWIRIRIRNPDPDPGYFKKDLPV